MSIDTKQVIEKPEESLGRTVFKSRVSPSPVASLSLSSDPQLRQAGTRTRLKRELLQQAKEAGKKATHPGLAQAKAQAGLGLRSEAGEAVQQQH